jgi:hypothetical protein
MFVAHHVPLLNGRVSMLRSVFFLAAALIVAFPGGSVAEEVSVSPEEGPEKIRDNLFLLEEAYNQEPGVIQHIQFFMWNPQSSSWSYSFTDEWPVPTDRHQLSLTVPVLKPGEADAVALGDILLNYRLQVLGMGGAGWIAMAPRLSLVLPSGKYESGTGRGVLGLQLNLPVSIDLGRYFVAHLNAGLTVTPGARSPNGYAETALDTNAGVALAWTPLSWANVLVEFAHVSTEEIRDNKTSARDSMFIVNPGLRFAITFSSGLQIVPGVSAPLQFTSDGTEVSSLFYLSFEHPMWTAPAASSGT